MHAAAAANAQTLMFPDSGILMNVAHTGTLHLLCEFLADTSDKYKTLLSDKSPGIKQRPELGQNLLERAF